MTLARFFLVLLLVLSQPLWADGLPAAEDMTSAEIVEELSLIFERQQTGLEELRTDLEKSSLELSRSRTDLEELRSTLTLQQERLGDSLQTLSGLESWLPNLLEEQQRTISSQETWLWVLSGVAAALAAGLAISFIM